MKPSDFVFPSYWNRAVPLLIENFVYFLPKPHLLSENEKYFSAFTDILSSLKQERPVICELCSGNGDWVVEQAKNNPQYFWIAVERRLDRVRKILSKKENHSVDNLLVIYGEAASFFHHYVAENTFYKIFINFPDPWPKTKHIKNRLINKSFVEHVFRILCVQGSIVLVTDDLDFLKYSLVFLQKRLQARFSEPPYIIQQECFGKSWFEVLWRNKGKQIFYSEFIKQD